jgi:glycine/D-amino acid oxidase-like deaminating enzyme
VESFDVVILGGGVAGLSTAWHLARAGVTRVCVLEREWACGTQASGHNAAIFRQFEADAEAVRLARRTRTLLEVLSPTEPLLRTTGAIYVGTPARLAPSLELLAAHGIEATRLSPEELRALAPAVATGPGQDAVHVPSDGVLDPHGMLQALQARLREAGVAVRVSVDAVPARRDGGFVVATPRGDLRAGQLVLAAGAWNGALGARLGAQMTLRPLRRHLALLEAGDEAARGPVVWRFGDDEAYFRPESGGVLASPCDETEWTAEAQVPVDAHALASLGERLTTLAPTLAHAQVRRAWACLRTFTPDRSFLAGADPLVPGLFWCAGLGGRGMSCGLALGEWVATALTKRAPPRVAPLG